MCIVLGYCALETIIGDNLQDFQTGRLLAQVFVPFKQRGLFDVDYQSSFW
jgi:hypothetical protein